MGFLRCVGHALNRQIEPDREGQAGKNPPVSIGQRVVGEAFPTEIGEGEATENQQLSHRQNRDDQFKERGLPDSPSIQGGKYQIGPDGDDLDRNAAESLVDIGRNRHSDGWRREDKFNDLNESTDAPAEGAEGPRAVDKGSTRPGDCTCQLGVAEDEAHIHEGDENRGRQHPIAAPDR